MYIHFAAMLIIYKTRKKKFPQDLYDNFFQSIENNLRELGFGDVAVNKKMKDLNKVFYDILLKINDSKTDFIVSKKLISKYFPEFSDSNNNKYELLAEYFVNFYNFCFELNPETMIKDAINFKEK